jgi:hypothetical protein
MNRWQDMRKKPLRKGGTRNKRKPKRYAGTQSLNDALAHRTSHRIQTFFVRGNFSCGFGASRNASGIEYFHSLAARLPRSG